MKKKIIGIILVVIVLIVIAIFIINKPKIKKVDKVDNVKNITKIKEKKEELHRYTYKDGFYYEHISSKLKKKITGKSFSSAFNYRLVENSVNLSWHCFGLAIDINPLYNPYFSPFLDLYPILDTTNKKNIKYNFYCCEQIDLFYKKI